MVKSANTALRKPPGVDLSLTALFVSRFLHVFIFLFQQSITVEMWKLALSVKPQISQTC